MAVKTYRVTCGHLFHGTRPGKTFEADYPPEHEARLIERGSIEVVEDSGESSGDQQQGSPWPVGSAANNDEQAGEPAERKE